MNFYFASPILLNILVGGLVFIVIIVMVVKTITGRKHKTDENKQRRREVAKKIKEYVKVQYNYTNVSIGFKKIVQRTGAAYRNREIYDVIVSLLNLKTNKLVCLKAFEVEAVKKQVAPKMFDFI